MLPLRLIATMRGRRTKMANILVVYGTRNGSTGEVAAAIAATLQQSGHTVSIAAASRMRDPVGGFDLVVIGGALYSGRWHPGAHRFLRKHKRELTGCDVAVFGMGPRRDVSEAWETSRAQLERALAKRPWLRPVAVTVFGGVDPPKKRERRDIRDWQAITQWARHLSESI
jgi:menaquinone-dependent protoporphyrinogen oxidase